MDQPQDMVSDGACPFHTLSGERLHIILQVAANVVTADIRVATSSLPQTPETKKVAVNGS